MSNGILACGVRTSGLSFTAAKAALESILRRAFSDVLVKHAYLILSHLETGLRGTLRERQITDWLAPSGGFLFFVQGYCLQPELILRVNDPQGRFQAALVNRYGVFWLFVWNLNEEGWDLLPEFGFQVGEIESGPEQYIPLPGAHASTDTGFCDVLAPIPREPAQVICKMTPLPRVVPTTV